MRRSIVFADIVGYSAHMERFEQDTHVISSHALDLVARLCKARDGRVCQLQGDDVMLVFKDARIALDFAVEMQTRLTAEPLELPDGERIVFRVGIHCGPVIRARRSVRGNTVNVAKRTQERAAPGAVCATEQLLGEVPEQARERHDIHDLGFKNFKGILEPYRLYAVGVTPPGGTTLPRDPVPGAQQARRDYDRPPNVAVCPFRAQLDAEVLRPMSSAVTDEIVSHLSRRTELVLHSPGIFADDEYRPELILRLCRRFGIDYVVDGLVSRDSDGFKVRAELLGTSSGRVLCSAHFRIRHDERVADLARGSAKAALHILCNVLNVEGSGLMNDRQPDGRYRQFLLGQKLAHTLDEASNQRAIRILEDLLNHDAENTHALVELAHARHMAWRYDWGEHGHRQLDAAIEDASRATIIDPLNAAAFSELGFALIFADDIDASMSALDSSFDLNPDDPWMWANLSDAHVHMGNVEEGLRLLERSLAVNATLHRDWRIWSLAEIHFFLGDYENVVKSVGRMKDWTQGSRLAAASLGLLGRKDDAAPYVQRILGVQPGFRVSDWARKHPSTSKERMVTPLSNGLVNAGLPR